MSRIEPSSSSSLAELYQREYLRLVRLALNFVDDLAIAEDVVQDVFAQLEDRDLPIDPVRYLQRSVVNRSRSILRRRRVARAFLTRMTAPSAVCSPEDAMIRAGQDQALLQAVRALPVRQREVIILRYYEDMRVLDIATVLGISSAAASACIRRALKQLGNHLRGDETNSE